MIIKQGKYEVGDRVKIVGKDKLCKCEFFASPMLCWASKTAKIIERFCEDEKPYRFAQDKQGWWWFPDMIEGKVVDDNHEYNRILYVCGKCGHVAYDQPKQLPKHRYTAEQIQEAKDIVYRIAIEKPASYRAYNFMKHGDLTECNRLHNEGFNRWRAVEVLLPSVRLQTNGTMISGAWLRRAS